MSNYYNRQWRLPNAWNGTESNVSKQSNYSMDFDGSNYIDVGNPTELQFGDEDFSITSWFKMSTSQSNNLVGKFEATGNQRSYSIWIDESGSGFAKFVISNNGQSGSGNTTVVTDNNSLSLNNWHFVAVVYDSTNNLAKISVDGNSFVTSSHSGGAYSSSTANFRISNINGLFFDGQIDAVSIYNFALSASQVTTLYGSSSTGIGNPMTLNPKPVFYAPLGDQDSFNGSNYLVPNSSLKDYVFSFNANYVDLGDSDDFSFTNGSGQDLPFTLSAWVNMNDASSFRIITKYGTNTEWYLYTTGSDILRFRTNDSSTGGYIGRGYSTAMTSYENKWIHIVGTYDGSESNSGFKLYINATRVDDTDAGSGTYNGMVNSTDTVKIGKMTGSDVTNGKMSNVQIFDTALPATGSNSVETLYNNGSPLTSMTGFTSLQGWWKLDASATYNSSTTTWTISDDSTNSNDGTSSGMNQSALQQSGLSFKTSYSPYALDFDGTDDYINCNTSLNGMSSITYSVWIKPEQPSGNYGYILTAGNYSTTDRMLSLGVSSGQYSSGPAARELFVFGGQGAGGLNVGRLNYYVTYGTWYHIAIVYTNNQDVDLYVNGNAEGSIQFSDTSSIAAGSPTRIGAYSGTLQNYFNGIISNVSIWNVDLTQTQIREIYSEGVPQNLNNHSAYSNLVSWWQLGSNTSWVDPYWIALDEKGTNNGESQNVAAPNNMGESAIVDGVGSYANGVGTSGLEVVGDAPYSTANALSINMDVLDRTTDIPS